MKVITFICHGIKTCLVDLYNLCDSYDTVFCIFCMFFAFSEELCIPSQVHPDFEGYRLSAINTCTVFLKAALLAELAF